MVEQVVIAEQDLAPFRRGDTLGDAAAALLEQQRGTWKLLEKGYASLATVQTRVFEFDDFELKVQFNPGRLTSSSARVDDKTIKERPCFLCARNLPEGQRGLLVHNEYLLLCNPFPIFPEHFTIAHREHRPQRLLPSLGVMLELARELAPRYTLVYNGPRCGASAPDHLHLQAGVRGFMPFEREADELAAKRGEILVDTLRLRAFTVKYYLRTFVALQSANAAALLQGFSDLHEIYQEIAGGGEEEPMMNVLCWYDEGAWILAMFARAKHRPSFFYEEGDNKLLLSPAAVDVGGVCTLPIERDFRRITRDHLVQMFEEVSLDSDSFEHLTRRIRKI
jgi:ATP adenylyltransferase/5',5'''-P-1,P-4-tetraphosphate phosphorylase II